MPYLCGFWRFANAYSLKYEKGVCQMKKVWIAVLTVMLAAAISMSAAAQTELVIFFSFFMMLTLYDINFLY